MSKYIKILDYLFILRPIILIPFWTFFLLGYYRGGHFSDQFNSVFLFHFDLRLMMVGGVYTLLMGGIYILNQIFDIETDRLNNKLYFLPKNYISLRTAWLEAGLLFFISLVTSYFFGTLIFMLMVFSFSLGIAYSVPPLKLKGKPILDLLANAVGYGGLAFGTGWLVIAPPSMVMFQSCLPYMLAVGAVFVNTTIPDIPGDSQNGDITTGVWLGKRNAGILSVVLLCLTMISSFWSLDMICLITALFGFPFFLWAMWTKQDHHFLISFQITGSLFVFFTSLLMPIYFLFLVVIFFVTRWYYRHRFDVNYPTIAE